MTGQAQHPALDYALGQHIGKIEGRVVALEGDRTRLTHVEQQVSEIRAEQAAAKATREAQHAETMAMMGALGDAIAPLKPLPGMVAQLMDRTTTTERRLDGADSDDSRRTFTIRLPDPSFKAVLATLMAAAAIGVFFASLMGWRPPAL